MWLIARLTPEATWSAHVRIGCLLLFTTAGALTGLSAVMAFRKARTTLNPLTPGACSTLVDTGAFRFTRNPMYLAMLMVLTGWALFLGSICALVAALLFVAYMNRFQIRPEEKVLESIFGDAFTEYRHRVRRWL
jgi:protein-S-isoprenylcysteine O-methyltransferase Ste14